jgi:dolichol-phosphate mannosyltransferase
MKKLISIVVPCLNEALNINIFYKELALVLNGIEQFDFEIIFIDNASTDETVNLLKNLVQHDLRVKIIRNLRNFGPVRSPYWGLMQSNGEATILIASDLQDPPSLIPILINEWLCGWKVVLGIKPLSKTNFFTHKLRLLYYRLLKKISDHDVIENANGFGLYDKQIISIIKIFNDPYPYLRGIICEIGYPVKTVEYIQHRRSAGESKSNLIHLYDVAMLGFINNSTLPLRLTSFIGFFISLCSFISCIFFAILKLINWDNYSAGVSTLISANFFLFGLLFCFLGILGEYVASIFTQLRNRPPVIEKERINF